ncbi:MAG: hypothetical protein HN341_10930 [Verrucomicrobia bacterium]|nr:hypothetical protein [Verrucomicrobiota bacterium]
MKTEQFTLEFGETGKLELLNLTDGTSLLTADAPGDGFVLRGEGDEAAEVPLDRLVPQDDGRLLATTRDGTRGVVLDVKETAKYLAFRIVELRGIDSEVFGCLDFTLNAKPYVRVMELDYMTTIQNHEKDDDCVRVRCPYLKHGGDHNPYGGFALYVARDPDDEDDTMLRIWADEGLPHPKVDGPWNLEAARRVVEEWQSRYADQSQFYLAARNPEELYDGVQYAERAGVKDVYLFTDTWHADAGFWPQASLNWAVNKKVFPRGEADLRAFSDHVASKGMHVKIHWVSGGIPFRDPHYILPKLDDRLATWVSGTLAEAVDAEAATLLFKPGPGAREKVEEAVVHRHGIPSFVRVGDELIQVGSFANTDADVWELTGCSRGVSGTPVSDHAADAGLVGLVTPYNIVFTPDVDSTLLDEMAEGFAGLVNRCRIMNVEFDGFEIHGYAGRWGCEKFGAKVYASLDHTVSSNTSGGSAPRCWIEYRLNSSKHLMRGNKANTHGGYSAAAMLDSPERPASRVAEAHFSLSKAAAKDSNRFSVTKPQPMFGVSPRTLEQHGRADEIIGLVREWKEASIHLTEAQRETMLSTFMPAEQRLRDASREPCSEVVWTLREEREAWQIVPVRVLTRKDGDIRWHSWQEHGPIMPRQFIKAGQSLRLINPNAAQVPGFIIQCLSAFDPEEPTSRIDPSALKGLQWIWDKAGADTAPPSTAAETICLRKTFELPPAYHGGKARFLFAVDDQLELWINGAHVDKGGASTQMTVWDITRYLKPGENVIAVAATSFGGPAGLVGTVEIEDARSLSEQREAEEVSAFEGKAFSGSFGLPIDASWRCATAAPEGWQEAGSDDSGWGMAVPLVELGDPPWGAVGGAGGGSIPLQPAAGEMEEAGEMQFADSAEGLCITCDNRADEPRTFEDALPFFARRVNMTSHRGIALEVTGDGSGTLLVVRIPGRDYVVPIDFTGTRTIEIPKGEVSWADGRWGWRVATHHANYAVVGRVQLGFGAVPGKTRASVEVRNLRALREIATELKDPEIKIGQGVLRCSGAVQTGDYLEYTGGQTAHVYDRNWNLLREVPVESKAFVMPAGEETVTISGADGAPVPWLDVQLMTDGVPLVVPKPESPQPVPPRYSGLLNGTVQEV